MQNKQNIQTVSFDDETLILVDKDDNEIGYKPKVECHKGDGILHRAFSIFIFNMQRQMLLQKRAEQKLLWPLFWSNSCCSHPRKGEDDLTAAKRRLKEELGLEIDLHYLYKFQYRAVYRNVGSENELCSVYIGRTSDPVEANRNEIAAWKFISIEDFEKDKAENSDSYTPWFKMEWDCIRKDHWQKFNRLFQI